MKFRRSNSRRGTRVVSLWAATVAAVALTAAGGGAVAAPAAAQGETVDRTTVVAADGTRWAIDAVNTGRGAGMLVEYTPDYGFSTFTNQWGAEAVLEATGAPNTYRVLKVVTAGVDGAAAGNQQIPADGLVISGGPAGDPDPVAWVTDHLAAGDEVMVVRPTSLDGSHALAATDPTPRSNPDGAPFPGYRGQDQLIQYTSAFGETTGTNEWGSEAVVQGGIITALGAASTAIPQDGYVLSGNGLADTWLRANAVVGASVEIADGTVHISSDVGTSIDNAARGVASVAATVSSRYDAFADADFTTAGSALDQAQALLDKARAAQGTDDQAALYYADQAAAAARAASYASTPSRVAESRGVWYRPVEASPAAIQATVDAMKRTGVNEVYLETLSGGYTIYPSAVAAAHGLPAVRPEFAGFDSLAAWKAAADKDGIELHAWIDGLQVGNELGDGVGPIVQLHPEWLAADRKHAGTTTATASYNGFYMLDVTDPVARQYLVDVTAEMVGKYHLAGLDLDYMRYWDNGNVEDSYNFSDDSRGAYEARTGIDPVTLSRDADADAWGAWATFVNGEENRLVADIARDVKKAAPAAVVSDAPEVGTENDKIGQWNDALDVVVPQAYTANLDSIHQRVAGIEDTMTGGQLVYTGLSAMYERLGADRTVEQTQAAHDLDQGTVIFSWGQAGPAHVTALSSGPWREAAVSPGVHPIEATRAMIDDAAENIAGSYLPRGGISSNDAKAYLQGLAAVKSALGTHPTEGQITAALRQLAALGADVERERAAGHVADAVASRLGESLGTCTAFLTYASERGMR
ncbi:glycoside hydrolase family 10 protein [Xylanimonas sp. McL0601]|uniref:glycoside hydrolase family 10 protein n=1 Tax=Xylanimonas sp. McL0601 TaxID=3414739 RepID=UPI003CF343F6